MNSSPLFLPVTFDRWRQTGILDMSTATTSALIQSAQAFAPTEVNVAARKLLLLKWFVSADGDTTLTLKSNGVAKGPAVRIKGTSLPGFIVPFDGEQWFELSEAGYGFDVTSSAAVNVNMWALATSIIR